MPERMLKSRMLGNPLVRFCEGRGGNYFGAPRLLDQGEGREAAEALGFAMPCLRHSPSLDLSLTRMPGGGLFIPIPPRKSPAHGSCVRGPMGSSGHS